MRKLYVKVTDRCYLLTDSRRGSAPGVRRQAKKTINRAARRLNKALCGEV